MLKKVAEEFKSINTVEQLKQVLSDKDWTEDELMDYIDDTWRANSALQDWFMTFDGLDNFHDEATANGFVDFLLSNSENYGYVKDAIEQVGLPEVLGTGDDINASEEVIKYLINGIKHDDKCLSYLQDDIDYMIEKVDKIMDDLYQSVSEYDSQHDDGSVKYTDEEWDKLVEEDYQDALHSRDTMYEVSKDLFKFTSENVHHNRTIEKNNLFKEDMDEKNEKIKKHNEEKFSEIDRLTERSVLELDALERKLMNNQRLKKLEDENMELLSKITKLERDSHMAQAKIAELDNTQAINKKHLLDEELTRNIHLKENDRLNIELDNLSKLNEEKLKEKVKESEAKQILVIKNQISNSELKMGLLLNKYKEEEATARNLLEEKNALMQKISNIKEDIDNQTDAEGKTKAEIIEVKNNINQLTELINDNTAQLEVLQTENQKLNEENEKYEKDIKELRIKIDELQQKIELNSMLKDIDIGELKMLVQQELQ